MVTPQTSPTGRQQTPPGRGEAMVPAPEPIHPDYRGSGKLAGKVALVTGADSGIGRAVAIHFAREGCAVAVAYLEEDDDAEETRRWVEAEGQRCLTFRGDLGYEERCRELVRRVIDEFGQLDILVNNAGEQHPQPSLTEISAEQLERTFRTNIFAFFYLTKAALPYLGRDAVILNTTSVTACRGDQVLLDYSSSKGAIVAFTRALASQLAEQGIRVNAVAPGPIWTPLIPAAVDEETAETVGKDTPFARPGQPADVAPCYVFLASGDGAYMTGQVLHPNGGEPAES